MDKIDDPEERRIESVARRGAGSGACKDSGIAKIDTGLPVEFRSKRDGVPAYVVFHDSTLVAIAAQRPTTLAGLRTIPGIGPTKLDRYGDDIIEVLETAAAG